MRAALTKPSLIGGTKPLLAIALVCLLAACGNNKSFDATAWQQGDPRKRGSMAEDLVKRKLLLGRPAEEVQRLLGRPDKDHVSALVYNIDLGWVFKDPSHYGFIVHLDANRNVREAKIVD